MDLLDLFEIQRLERPEAPALRDPATGTALTHRDLFDRVDAAATGLAARGLVPGERVAFYADGSAELVVAHLAVLRCGGIAVPINLAYREREVGHILEDAAPRLVIADAARRPVLDAVPPAARSSVEEILDLHEPRSAPRSIPRDPRGPSGSTGSNAPSSGTAPPVDGSDPALIVYTSGTTGKSKGAVLTHDNLLATVTGLLAAWAWQPDDVLLLALPLFHVHGLVVGLHTALAAGASVILHRRSEAAAVVDALGRGEATRFFGVPTLYRRLLAELDRRSHEGNEPPRFDRVRLFCSGSAPLAEETFDAFRRATGHAILERYGMSETGMNLSNPYAGRRRPGTVGTPLPGVSVRIVETGSGDDGATSSAPLLDVPPGGEGELLVRGSNVFAGYWRDPDKTAASFVADAAGRLWFRTGDLARRDPDTGFYTLLGRRGDLILRGGLNVYPREIEEVLERLPGVREAAVVGRPDAEYGQVPVACVVPDPENPPGADELLARCREELAAFKVPVAVEWVERLPRNALGKVQRGKLGIGN